MTSEQQRIPSTEASGPVAGRCAVAAGSASAALADRIVSAIEGRFRDWLMFGEHAEAKQLVAEILDRELNGWTVKAEDYDRLSDAAKWLRRACNDRLPPGHYANLDDECRAIDTILHPNATVRHAEDRAT